MRTKKQMSVYGVLAAAMAALLVAGGAHNSAADDKGKAAMKSASGFSFAAYGDSRPMMYLPLKEGQPDVSMVLPVGEPRLAQDGASRAPIPKSFVCHVRELSSLGGPNQSGTPRSIA